MPQCPTKSAFDKNLSAKISSTKPKTTFNVSIHEPDFGSDLSMFGKKANSVKGKPMAIPKETIPTTKFSLPFGVVAILPSNVPRIGPVQEKDTITNVSAMKNMPINPPTFEAESALLASELGSVIS